MLETAILETHLHCAYLCIDISKLCLTFESKIIKANTGSAIIMATQIL